MNGIKAGIFRSSFACFLHRARLWPGRLSTHLICGLGESEEELARLLELLLQADYGRALRLCTAQGDCAGAALSAPSGFRTAGCRRCIILRCGCTRR